MAREITSGASGTATGNFPPLVGIREAGQFVKGKVVAKSTTTSGNPALTLTLIDLNGSTSISPSKGVYQEVDVAIGDTVQIIGSSKQLKDKLPQVEVGEIVTITSGGKTRTSNGRSMNNYKVVVE